LPQAKERPDKPDAAHPAVMLWLIFEGQWRRVADLGRSAVSMLRDLRRQVAGKLMRSWVVAP